jgi:hypothetical protein
MGRQPHYPEALRDRIFRGSHAVRRGLLTPAQLRTSRWKRVYRDVYADAAIPDSHLFRCEAVGLILPPTAVLTGRSAACVRGLPLGELSDPVHVLIPAGTDLRLRGIRAQRGRIPPGHVLVGRPPITVPTRTAWEIAREPNLVDAVAALDVLLGHGYVTTEALAAWVAASPRSRATLAINLADGRAESPPESKLRVRLTLVGLPLPIPQFRVHSCGRFVARLDLAWPEKRVGCEYDGEWHAELR